MESGYYWIQRPARKPEPAHYDARLERFEFTGEDQRCRVGDCVVLAPCEFELCPDCKPPRPMTLTCEVHR